MNTDKLLTSKREHDVQLTLAGDAESLRPRIVEALERVGYKVLDEHPLTARRGAQGAAASGCSFDVLDYPTKLNVSLKQLNEVAVLATFNFEVKHNSIMTSGDHKTLEREAEAIAALAAQSVAFSSCPACGTQGTDDSRFCRRCGAPLVSDVAELEVFRLTRGTRAALQRFALSGLLLMSAAFLSIFFFWANSPKSIKTLVTLVSIFGALGVIVLMKAMWQLHFTLNPREPQNEQEATPRPRVIPTQTLSLPTHQRPASVTEGTTELLTSSFKEPVAVPLHRQSRDTGPVN